MQISTVSDIVSQIKSSLESEFVNFVVEGETSNFSASSSGHYYFNLKDEKSMISCALFRGNAMRNPVVRQLKDGVKVQVYGDISVYAPRGTFQIIVKKIVPVGAGNLKERFERLKKKLGNEGLFDLERKKPIPLFPQKIGVVTALGAAALQDFLNIMKRRSLSYDIIISPSLVQGDQAPTSIMKALENLKSQNVDCVVVTRGGGSLEDLWAFNDEKLVRYLYEYEVPVISAVGHQVDFTLCDYVSDKRLETPSAAAELLSSPQQQIRQSLEHSLKSMLSQIRQKNQSYKSHIRELRPDRMISILQKRIYDYNSLMMELKNKLTQKIPLKVSNYYMKLDEFIEKIKNSVESQIRGSSQKLSELNHFLKAVDPSKVLSRGYAYAQRDKTVISSAEQAREVEESFSLTFHDGTVEVKKC